MPGIGSSATHKQSKRGGARGEARGKAERGRRASTFWGVWQGRNMGAAAKGMVCLFWR